MYTSIVLAAFATSMAIASPLPQTACTSSDDLQYSVTLKVIESQGTEENEHYSIVTANVGQLTPLKIDDVYQIQFVPGSGQNVDEDKIECRAYKDTAGQDPGSAPFNAYNTAFISTTGNVEGSVLCYRVTDSEASKW